LKEGCPVIVADLQQFLLDLSKLLRASKGSAVASELEYACSRLSPFKDFNLKAFADFLDKADAYSKGALAPKPKPPRGKKASAAEIEQVCQQALDLYNRAIDPNVTVELIEATVQALEAKDPSMLQLVELLNRMGPTKKPKSKADAHKAVRHKILGRKGAFDRVDA
jgi:hypothetical protein